MFKHDLSGDIVKLIKALFNREITPTQRFFTHIISVFMYFVSTSESSIEQRVLQHGTGVTEVN